MELIKNFMNNFLSVDELPRGALVTTPYLDGFSSDDEIDYNDILDDDDSSSHSCELDMEVLGETKTKMNSRQAEMDRLRTRMPILKVTQD